MTLTTDVDYEVFLDEVLPYVNHCSEIAAINAIRNACIQFCEESTYLRDTPDGETLVVNQGEYELDYPSKYEVSRIIAANHGYHKLKPANEEVLTHMYGADWRTVKGGPGFYTFEDPCTITIVPMPCVLSDDPLKYTLALKPSRSSTAIDRQIWERWAEVISHGARARLYETPGQPYYDPEAALRYRKWFESGIGEAKQEANRGRTNMSMSVRMPKFV